MIHGVTLRVIERTKTGEDKWGHPIWTENEVFAENILYNTQTSSDTPSLTTIEAKHDAYILAIPKTDNHKWENCLVEINGKLYEAVGVPQGGIESMIPLEWNRKLVVERYE